MGKNETVWVALTEVTPIVHVELYVNAPLADRTNPIPVPGERACVLPAVNGVPAACVVPVAPVEQVVRTSAPAVALDPRAGPAGVVLVTLLVPTAALSIVADAPRKMSIASAQAVAAANPVSVIVEPSAILTGVLKTWVDCQNADPPPAWVSRIFVKAVVFTESWTDMVLATCVPLLDATTKIRSPARMPVPPGMVAVADVVAARAVMLAELTRVVTAHLPSTTRRPGLGCTLETTLAGGLQHF